MQENANDPPIQGFQLGKLIFLTGNPVLGGHWHSPAFAPYFTLKGFSNTGKDVVKRFDRI
jgi:hypothetical protein